MKYAEFPNISDIIYADQNNKYLFFKNNSNSYILVMGYSYFPLGVTQEQTEPYWGWYAIGVSDPDGNIIDFVIYEDFGVYLQNAQIPVWNGTSAVLETGYIPVFDHNRIDHIGKSIIPPLGALYVLGSGSVQFDLNIYGGWGLILSEEELLQVIKK
ncbi:MAG: hypothetical protein QW478_10555 [Candidatus Micrarchaeaceae archaeon]